MLATAHPPMLIARSTTNQLKRPISCDSGSSSMCVCMCVCVCVCVRGGDQPETGGHLEATAQGLQSLLLSGAGRLHLPWWKRVV